MSCDVGKATEWAVAQVKRRKDWRMSCDIGEVMERLENEQSSHTHSRAHSPTFPSLHLRNSSFSNPSVALPTSQLILQSLFRFSYVTGSSLTLPGEPPMHISYVNYKIFAKYCGRHWQKQGSSSFLSVVKSHPLKIPASVLEKIRAGSCLKLFLMDCRDKF